MTQKQYVNFKTPRGAAKYPKLDQPYVWSDSANKSVPDPEGQYETKLVIPAKDAAPLIKVIDDAIKDTGIKPKHLPYRKEIDKESDEPTGNIEFTFKRYGKATDGKPNKIAYFDSKGVMIKRDVDLTSGSTIIVSGWISVAKMGARLNLKAVQVIKLVERQVDGFDAVEDDDAYVANDEEETDNEFDNEETDSGRPNF